MPNMRKCIVADCSHYTKCFNLPADEARRAVWLSRSGTPASVNFSIHWKICPLHFHEKCFLKAKKLHRWALPSLLLPVYKPTGEDRDICFIKSMKNKPPITPEKGIKRKSPCHDVEYSPVRKVRIPVRTYQSWKTTAATLVSEQEELIPVPLIEPQNPRPSKSQEDVERSISQVVSSYNVKNEIPSFITVERDGEQLSQIYMEEDDCGRSLPSESENYQNMLNENEDLKVEVQRLNLFVENMKQELLVSKQREIQLKQIFKAVKELVNQGINIVNIKQEI